MKVKKKHFYTEFTTYNLFKVLDCQYAFVTILNFIITNPFPKKSNAFTYADSNEPLSGAINFNPKHSKFFYLNLIKDNSLPINCIWNHFVKTLDIGILNNQLDMADLSHIIDNFNEKLGEAGIYSSQAKVSKKISVFISN